MLKEIFYRIQTDPVLEFRRGPLGLPVPVRPKVLGEAREGQMVHVIDPYGNDYGEISVRNGVLTVHRAEHTVGYNGPLKPTTDGAVIDGNVFLQHRYTRTPLEYSPMIKIQRTR